MLEQFAIFPPPKTPSLPCPFKAKQTSILSLELPHGQPVEPLLPSSKRTTEIPLGAVKVRVKSPSQVWSIFTQTCSKKLFTPKLLLLVVSTTKFAVMSSVYSTIAKDKAGTVNNNKKNVYYSVKESIDKLVDALKYVVRYNS